MVLQSLRPSHSPRHSWRPTTKNFPQRPAVCSGSGLEPRTIETNLAFLDSYGWRIASSRESEASSLSYRTPWHWRSARLTMSHDTLRGWRKRSRERRLPETRRPGTTVSWRTDPGSDLPDNRFGVGDVGGTGIWDVELRATDLTRTRHTRIVADEGDFHVTAAGCSKRTGP